MSSLLDINQLKIYIQSSNIRETDMTKITHRGSWIQISSLNKEDKKNYLTSITLFVIGAFFWGIHLTSVDGIFCLLYTSPSPRDRTRSRMPSSA